MRHALTWLCLCVLAGTAVGCGDPIDGDCPQAVGIFLASYQKLDGTCEPTFSGNTLEVKKTDTDRSTNVEGRLSDSLTTEITFKGCSLGVRQATDVEGRVTTHLAGDLLIDDSAQLSGTLTRVEYLDDGGVACQGAYDAHYTRRDVVVGGAVEHGGTAR